MQQLQELANERADAETRVANTLSTEMMAAESNYQGRTAALKTDFGLRRRDLENEYAQTKQDAADQHHAKVNKLQSNFDEKDSQSQSTYKQTAIAIERKRKEAEWQALAVFDAAKDKPQEMLDQAEKRLLTRNQQVTGLRRDANTLMEMRRLHKKADDIEPISEEATLEGTPEEQQQSNLNTLHQSVIDLQNQRLPSLLLEGIRPIGWWVFACVASAAAAGSFVNWSLTMTPLIGVIAGSVAAALVSFLVGGKAKQQSYDLFARIQGLLLQADELEIAARSDAQEKSRLEAERIQKKKDDDFAAAKANRDQATAKNEARRQAEAEHLQKLLTEGNAKADQTRDSAIAAADEKYPPLLDQLAREREAENEKNQQHYEQRKQLAQSAHDSAWQELADQWQTGFATIAGELTEIQQQCQQLFPDWSITEWSDWQRPAQPPTAIQFGSYRVPLSVVKNGLSADERLRPEQTEFELPALMPFDEMPRMVVTAEGEGRTKSVEILQALMLRFLTAMPAGKLRFTIIDPSALGENFAAFMHLADHDEQLIGGRIWTDPRQIEERLTLLADHMEKVLQKYLRNEFATLREYNEQAGEVAEPYHVLVMANFPAGLSDASIRKLETIATAGPRCGVYTLLGVDTGVKLPTKFDLSPLLKDAVHLQWTSERLVWKYPLYEKLPLGLDQVPPPDRLNDLLRVAAQESHDASRVEVPFEVVAPPDDQLWTESSARELVVPVGRAGAKELQALRLGRGTSQHVLISGKTGSGKSTLLHALITNTALHYSPDEVEFYLVDFKKGVEFKAYATGELPHARVIAIESEREFGVSVLQRLDEELRRRGERYRELGVQDLAGYRQRRSEDRGQSSDNGQANDPSDHSSLTSDPCPRILLVIDEFQELFVTDDKLSQDASLLLDRLVRQGRAFGIHVLLGSQTLAGAYSLARSTLGQMAVRVALECSEADAHLILSDDNSAARLLTRPGEAIYNDQNGMVEGNSPFQVVWLPDANRQQYLDQIRRQLPADQPAPEPAIVFEGNVPADPHDNADLGALISQESTIDFNDPTLWLGSAVRIEPPTGLTFRRQSGNNLLVVGQEEPLALGMLATAAITLAAQQTGTSPNVTVLDGTRPESPEAGFWSNVADSLPDRIDLHTPSTVTTAIIALADELARRNDSPEQPHAPHFVVIHDLAQFRNLRQTEEEFSFSSKPSDKPTPADKHFRNLLKEGPAVGMHVLVWCDSYNGLTRFVDRMTLREIDYRVAMQMSAADSTSLIDSPAAGRIGEQRAVFYRDDLGTQVKFRPYGKPTSDWLTWSAEQLSAQPAVLRNDE
ncbi:MAG: FtsK/SpoIIIE domain-containing protein [Planctomycetota bacterium]